MGTRLPSGRRWLRAVFQDPQRTVVVCGMAAAASGARTDETVFWAPGLWYGLALAIVHGRGGWLHRAAFVVLAALIYESAVGMTLGAPIALGWSAPLAAGVAGAWGAWALLGAGAGLGWYRIRGWGWRTAAVGGLAGVVFLWMFVVALFDPSNSQGERLRLIAAYAMWQIPVGWPLMRARTAREASNA